MFNHIFQLKGSQPESSSHCYMVESFLNAATFSKDHEGHDKSMSFEDFKSWCNLVPSVKKFLSNLLVLPDRGFPCLCSYICPFICNLYHSSSIVGDIISCMNRYLYLCIYNYQCDPCPTIHLLNLTKLCS